MTVEMKSVDNTFRGYLFPLSHPRLRRFRGLDAVAYADAACALPLLQSLTAEWRERFENTKFAGVTADGLVRDGLFELRDNGAPVAGAVEAAKALVSAVDAQQRLELCHGLDSKVWRAWMNPELYMNRFGLRLENLDSGVRSLVFGLLRSSLSDVGYEALRNAMLINGFLGELVDLPGVLNELSYNINIFGDPSLAQPWGWNFYGHHISLNCLFIGGRMTLTPVFLGSEPNSIDAGNYTGLEILKEHATLGLEFVRSLSAAQVDSAVLYRAKRDPSMPSGRIHPADELHLAGAFQDNRVIPYEGLAVGDCDSAQREHIVAIVAKFLEYMPGPVATSYVEDARQWLSETYFCWIGGTEDCEPFYYRIQSPVILVEFDHHAGVFLTNRNPAPFHTHTVVRTPNGNDYGVALRRKMIAGDHLLDGPP
jgi:hypothetical protein